MCGIFGQIGRDRAPERCALSIRHRGPDDAGARYFDVPGTRQVVTLAHRRLSIIDLSPAGHNPMSNEDGSVWLVFNGEVYNYAGLRSELMSAGHQFRSNTDTETIIHGYEQWGDAVVERLFGMFAFALWDQRRSRLLLARDRLGKKPIFYYSDGERLVFGSEIKTILAAGVKTEPDPVALHDYLTYLYFPYPKTAFKNIVKMPPATRAAFQVKPDGRLEMTSSIYWDALAEAGKPLEMSERDIVEHLRQLLEETVRERLMSDVPLGLFLSGGLDSSAITAIASDYGKAPVKTFSIGFSDSKFYDEIPFANQVAKKFNTEHHVLQADPQCIGYLTKVVHHFDEPFGNPTAVLELILTKLMREHVTVAISGDGGDEIFGGYVRYVGASLANYYRKLPRFLTKGMVAHLAKWMNDATDGRHGFRRAREFAESAWMSQEAMYLNWIGYFSEAEKHDMYTPGFASQLGGHDSGDFLRALFQRSETLDSLNQLGYVDLGSFLTGNCLEYSDRMSMANSLEVRCPLTDHRLVEFALRIPPRMKVRMMKSKWILREAMRGILPPDVIEKKKVGFNPPLPQWLNGELKPLLGRLLSREVIEQRGMFQPEPVARLLRDHFEQKRDNSLKIWALLMLEIWQRMYVDHQAEADILEECFSADSAAVGAVAE